MKEQTLILKSVGIHATYIGEHAVRAPNELFKNMEVVFGTPESFLEDVWRDQLAGEAVSKRVQLLAVDEAHTIHHW